MLCYLILSQKNYLGSLYISKIEDSFNIANGEKEYLS